MKKRVLSKSLTHTDICKRLAIPTKSLAFLPHFCGGNAIELPVRDDNGCSWTFVCSLRKTGYAKPVLQKGWRHFVLAKGLTVGDKVTFYQQGTDDGIKVFGTVFPRSCYSIEVERAIKPSLSRACVDHNLARK
ncbi:B3 domain-containing transcription factor NGA4-like [Herrania umbratica]|uniref:B3 domain-containing transcription factor NGA4-like n=1 Tax=Herrania umbratica TaxID=108875 RepID=A0A6J1BM39_9ROSI|nr:B3 domain-containing transcription factor NGA4-like [Herrania umbratica]